MGYYVLFIDSTQRSLKFINAFRTKHTVVQVDSIEDGCEKLRKTQDKNIVIIWHLSSCFYNKVQLEKDNIEDAINEIDQVLKNKQNIYKYGVSDTDGIRKAAQNIEWFTFVTDWNELKEFFRI